ncbi:MAG: histone deacetylase [Rhodoferax ferrireducens]|uniref:Histone deacetylase n=1 Tax=Rhodoferax ferrireducens TaxID=192843 RepID=A0A1W9KYR1_9BURK|nr:MAG: histone deacetylase [Rhodoferax ferrireducens]
MDAFYSDHFVLPLPDGHRFPMQKYAMLRDAVQAQLPRIVLREAPRVTDEQLALIHSREYIQTIATGENAAPVMREIGFPWSPMMAERARRSVGATVAAVQSALKQSMAANLAGGTHHAYADKGGGFCVFNDVAVALRCAQLNALQCGLQPLKVAVIDLDVHQGNGTAHIFRDDPSVFTLSMHGEKNFPFRKEASDLDVGLPDGCGDDDYLAAMDQALQTLTERFAPGLVIYLAGADPFERDRLGRLKLTARGLQARDERLFAWCGQHQYPVAFVMAGGYGVDIEETVQLQLNTYRVGLAYWQQAQLLKIANNLF